MRLLLSSLAITVAGLAFAASSSLAGPADCTGLLLPAAPWVVPDTAEPQAASIAEIGGSRAPPTAVPTGVLPATLLRWAPELDRRQVVLGAIDPDHDDTYVYRLPYGEGVSYPVIQGYGSKLSHTGPEYFTVDFRMDVGTPVYAARDGVVVLFEDSHDRACWSEECGRLANFVVLLHSDGTTGEYYHLARNSVAVALGEHVRRGQLIARSGNTGYSNAPHLHFGVYRTERDGRTQSVPVRFLTDAGIIDAPRMGARYLNPSSR